MGELHLDIKVDILRRTYKVDATIGQPQVAYREKLGKRCEIDYTHKKQTGGSGQFARIKLVFEPGEPGTGFVFESAIVGGAVPKEFIPGVIKGLESGEIDCVIGTHRLLSNNVKFKNLGLLIVDEEQRFGVTHKETMKHLKADVDANGKM